MCQWFRKIAGSMAEIGSKQSERAACKVPRVCMYKSHSEGETAQLFEVDRERDLGRREGEEGIREGQSGVERRQAGEGWE